MLDNVINLNKYLKPKIRENFALVGGGNETSISDSTKVTKNFENNQKIDRSMMVESVTKLVNNVSSDVMQKNSSTAASAAGASNSLNLMDIECDTVSISGVHQGAQATNQTVVKSTQSNFSKISTEISTTIDKTIEKVGGTDLAALQAENTKQLNDFMGAMPGYDPDKAQKLASQCPDDSGSLISAGNKCNVSSSYELDASVKQSLELDESFKINDQDDISNEIQTKLDQANFASCEASASASNQIALQKVKCKDMKISDIEQQAIASLYMTCVFDQKNVSEIANKITNKISKKYNQIYDAVAKKGEEKGQDWLDKKMQLVDALAGAGVEKIMAAAGNLPPASGTSTTPDSGTTGSKTDEVKSDGSKSGGPTTDAIPTIGPKPGTTTQPVNFSKPTTPSPTPSTTSSTSAQAPTSQNTQPSQNTNTQQPTSQSQTDSLLSNPYVLYGGIGLIVLIILVIVIMVMSGSGSSTDDTSSDSDE